MPLPELEQRMAQARELFAQLRQTLPGLLELTAAARRSSSGKFREGEAEALESVLMLARDRPQLFITLANADEGDDPELFEIDMLGGRLTRARMLTELIGMSEELARGVSDTVLYLGDRTRPVLLAAYEIAKPHAKYDPVIRSRLAQVIDFYARRPSRRGAANDNPIEPA